VIGNKKSREISKICGFLIIAGCFYKIKSPTTKLFTPLNKIENSVALSALVVLVRV